jgi:hypothetical protein
VGSHAVFPKAGELIEFRAQRELSLQDRRILNLLIEHAGPQIASEQKHRIPLAPSGAPTRAANGRPDTRRDGEGGTTVLRRSARGRDRARPRLLDKQYRATLDKPVGMLGDVTPSPARTPSGREKIAAWLKYLEKGRPARPTLPIRWRPLLQVAHLSGVQPQ